MRLKVALTVATAVLLISALTGALTPQESKEVFVSSIIRNFSPLNQSVREMLSQGRALQVFPTLYVTIFYNNLKVALLNYLLGFTVVVPISVLSFNGYVVGTFLTYGDVVRNSVLLLPHGVFELSAIILSAALGLTMGWGIIQFLRKRDLNSLLEVVRKTAKNFVWVITLLGIAAFIEVFITPLLYAAYALISGSAPTSLTP